MADDALQPTGTEDSYNLFNEVFGGLSEAPEEDQPKIFKAFLLRGVDTMREHTILQLDLLEKIGSLALDNVQDVRLYSLEARIKELEQGKPLTFGAVVAELFFAIALEATLLAGMTLVGPVVAGTAAMLLFSVRTSARSASATRRAAAIYSLQRHRSELVGWELRLLNRLHTRQFMNKRKLRKKARHDKTVTAEELRAVRHAMEYYNRKYEFKIERAEVSQSIRASEEFVPRYESLTKLRISKGIQRLITDYAHHVDAGKSVSRSFAAAARNAYPHAFADNQPTSATPVELHETFTTGHSVAQLIAECESTKLDVNLHYGQLREILDLVEAEEIFEAFETKLVMEEIESNLFDVMELTEDMLAHLEDFTVPMELAIWLTYLEANGVLARDENAIERAVAGEYFRGPPRFIGDDFVESIVSQEPALRDSKLTRYSGRRYRGLHALDEHHSYYLFHKFARPAFASYSGRVPKSKVKDLGAFIHDDVAADAFKDVLGMPKTFFWSGENEERTTLVKEMGVVVIEYFIYLREQLLEKKTVGFSESVPAGTKIGALFGQFEQPMLADLELAAEPTGMMPQELFDQYQVELTAEWEARVLASFVEQEQAYDLALVEYERALAVNEAVGADLPLSFMESYVMDQARGRLLGARSQLEQSIGAVIYEEQRRVSDAVDDRIDALERKLMNCPIESEMLNRLPR